MSKTLKPYLDSVRLSLEKALCIRRFPSQDYERQSKPEVRIISSSFDLSGLRILSSILCVFFSSFLFVLLYLLLNAKVEVRNNKELLLEPILLRRSENERCLIEPSINSVRISIRFKFEDADPIEEILGKKFLSFLMKRAEDYAIMRRIPIEVSSSWYIKTIFGRIIVAQP